MSEQDDSQISTLRRPSTNDDKEAWKTYWKAQGQRWRTEPEIDMERQKHLAERRSIKPDIEQGIYPFNDVEPKLTRADVEWLLATHENGRGPVDWSDESQRVRKGLDLRGANLSNLDLSGLPLTSMLGSLDADEWRRSTLNPSVMAAVNLERAFLNEVHFEGAYLRRAHLNGAELYAAHMEEADFLLAQFNEAFLFEAHLEKANLRRANFEGANLEKAHLEGANLRLASFDSKTILENITFSNEQFGIALITDVNWNNVNLELVKWSQLKLLDDKHMAQHWKTSTGNKRLEELEMAVRANRQLGNALQAQGLNEDAAGFAYRAQRLQRSVLLRQRKFGQYLFSGFLDLIAGYGYKPGRSVLWYLGIISLFTLAYHLFGGLSLYPPDAFVYSLTSFHGRGFFPGLSAKPSLHDPLILLAALEAVIGLFIEISFIATFTQRFFGK